MTGINVNPDALRRVADDMRTSTAKLDAAAKNPVSEVNAGKSSPEVQAAIATLLRASAGLLDGTLRTADEVAAGRTDYLKTDDGAAENMPHGRGGN
ncbi:hypothetical protein [Saccharopolyspora rosea]|uniref:hypothetical protein n=1 Tax=Saccharopolyspora rosea TaxID=524884 RepID=UPI0021DB1FD0|nr:hypothetical protein [Saccharopolyspora rosea]